MIYSVNIKAKVKESDKLYKCLLPEIHKMKRGSLEIDKADGHIEIRIKAKDAVALRALTNSITQLLSIFERTGDIGEQ